MFQQNTFMMDPIADQTNEPQKIEIFISGRYLTSKSKIFNNIDPKVKVYMKNEGGKYEFVGETEEITKNSNPNFSKSIIIEYNFEKIQHIKFDLLDVDIGQKYELYGRVETTIAKIMGAPNQISIFKLMIPGKKLTGSLIIRCEVVSQSNEWLSIQCSANNLKSQGFCQCFGMLNPKLAYYRSTKNGLWDKVFETEVILSNKDPEWEPFEINFQKLANCDKKRNLKASVYNRNGNNDKLIGEALFTIDDWLSQNKKKFELFNPYSKKKVGTLAYTHVVMNTRPTFLDYIKNGIQLSTILAIDFTGSNEDPHDPQSLHAIRGGATNHYQKAIEGVMDILINYDHDNKVAMYGFGAITRFPNLMSDKPSHCFPCNGNIDNPFVNGIEEIDRIYRYCLENVNFAGPTYFSPLLNEVLKRVKKDKENNTNVYTILVIMTDGQINDMNETVDCIVEASLMPISIIIVGIGSDDFTKMKTLDSDDQELINSRGIASSRDCVQFVSFMRFRNDSKLFGRHVLEEVPYQVSEYYRLMNVEPKSVKLANIDLIHANQICLSSSQINLQDQDQDPDPELPTEHPLNKMREFNLPYPLISKHEPKPLQSTSPIDSNLVLNRYDS